MRDTFLYDAIVLRRHQKQRFVTVTFDGMIVSVHYLVSVSIKNDICMLASRILSQIFIIQYL